MWASPRHDGAEEAGLETVDCGRHNVTMFTYRIDFPRDSLKRDPEGPKRLMRDVKKAVAQFRLVLPSPTRYVKKRRPDGSVCVWFHFLTDKIERELISVDLLRPYKWTPSPRPSFPESEWKDL